jgi:hypothetical protein
MAEVPVTSPLFTASLGATNQFTLPQCSPGPDGKGRWIIEFANPQGGWSGIITMKARLAGNAQAFQPVPYIGLSVNGVVGTGLPVSGTITTTSLIAIDGGEQEICADLAWTAGTIQMTARRALG